MLPYRHVLPGLIAVLLGAVSIGAQEPRASKEPTRALNRFYKTLARGKPVEAERAVIEPSEERRLLKLKKSLEMMARLMSDGKLEMRALESRVQGDWAVVVGRTKLRDGDTRVDRIREQFMVRQGKKWKVVPEGVRSDPAVKPLRNDDSEALFKWYRANQERLRKKYLGK